MKKDGETGHPGKSLKPRRPKSREVSSRYLSQNSLPCVEDIGVPSPLSELKQKPRLSTDNRKQRSLDDGGFMRGQWPSTTPPTISSNKKLDSPTEHLGKDRLKDRIIDNKVNQNSENSMFLNKQRSCTVFSRFEKNETDGKRIVKENHKTFFGGSMRHDGKIQFPRRSSNSSSNTSSDQTFNLADEIVPGRLSFDVNILSRRSHRQSDSLTDNPDSESEFSDISSDNRLDSTFSGKSQSLSYMNSTASSRNSGVEVSSKNLFNLRSKTRRGTSNSNTTIPAFLDNTPKQLISKSVSKRANAMTAYGVEVSKPGRGWLSPMSVDNKGKPLSSSNLRPKRVGDLLSKGLGLFRSKKSTPSAAVGLGVGEGVHQLRLAHNRLVQWRFTNARSGVVNESVANQSESHLIGVMNTLANLRLSVAQKKLQLEKEKLEMKLDIILHSHIKSLEAWEDIETQHLSAVSRISDCFHSVICRVPLVEGAKMQTHSASVAIGHARELANSINSMLHNFSPEVEKRLTMLSELAEIVTQEKALLDEFLELLKIVSTLEIQERSLKCSLIQTKLYQQEEKELDQKNRDKSKKLLFAN